MKKDSTYIFKNIDKNIDWFREKLISNKSSGIDMAKLMGLENEYIKAVKVNEEKEIIERVNSVLQEKQENNVDSIKDIVMKRQSDVSEAEENENTEQNDKEENKDETEERELKPGETTTLRNFDEFFNRTNTTIKITKDGKEPSPLFGSSDTKDHNKYKVTITNDKGGNVSWIYWDSLENTNSNKTPDIETVMKDFGLKLETAVVGTSFDNFKKTFGYENSEDSLAQEQYNNLRKMKDNIKKIYPDEHQVYELIQVAKKI